MFSFTKYSKFYYLFSGILVLASIAALAAFGLRLGIEFTGGSAMQLEFTKTKPSNQAIIDALKSFDLGEVVAQPTGGNGVILQFKGVDEAMHQKILAAVNKLSGAQEKSFQYIGPSVGTQLRNKTEIAIALALVAITLYIAFAFRKVSRPVASWKYGLTSLAALFHDIIIPLGAFAVFGKFFQADITIPIVAALLTILGFSVHDTIVIFDRIRENLRLGRDASFAETVDRSLRQTIVRSLSTVATVLLVMLALLFFGGSTLRWFSVALVIGVVSGAYSSIFIASPLLVSWNRWREKRQAE